MITHSALKNQLFTYVNILINYVNYSPYRNILLYFNNFFDIIVSNYELFSLRNILIYFNNFHDIIVSNYFYVIYIFCCWKT